MQFTLSRSGVQSVAQQLIKTCNSKNERSRLDGYIYFEAGEDPIPDSPESSRITLTAATTNGAADQVVTVPTVALSARKGDGFFVEAALFCEFLKTFAHDEVLCKLTGRKGGETDLLVGSPAKNTYLNLPTIGKDNYAPVHFSPEGGAFALDGKSLGRALRLSAFSAASDPKMPAITAVKLTVGSEALTAVSTDNNRVSRVVVGIEDAGVRAEFLVPRASADILGQLLAQSGDVLVQPGRNHLRVSWEGTVFTTALEMSGAKYPNVEKFFSYALSATSTISRGELLAGLKITGLIAKDTYINLDLDPDRGLMISAKQRNGTTTEVTVAVQAADRMADSVVAYKHLKGAVDVIASPWLTLEFRALTGDILAPILLDGEGFEHLILPIDPNDEEPGGEVVDGA